MKTRREIMYTWFVYLTDIQLPWVFLGNGDVVFTVLQSRIKCSFRMVIRELKAAHAQPREEKARKHHLHAHLHPSSTELLSPDHCAGYLSPFLKYRLEIQMCTHVCAHRSGPRWLGPRHFTLLCHHCQHNCLCSTHLGQLGKPIRVNQPKKKSVLFLRPVCSSARSRQILKHAAGTVGWWKRGKEER